MQRHPQAPGVVFRPVPGGFHIACERCQVGGVFAPAGANTFAAQHARCGSVGAGDAVAAVAKPVARALGLDPDCSPCAQRQAALNRMFPHLWRR